MTPKDPPRKFPWKITPCGKLPNVENYLMWKITPPAPHEKLRARKGLDLGLDLG